jgi:phosphoribosylamine--glycine ligase
MKILVVGSGGREHAICTAFARSNRVSKIYCANGNAGIAEIAECVDIKPENIKALAAFASAEAIDLTFVGGETALAEGIVDLFEKQNLAVIGASQKAAQLESSKAFAKDFMSRHSVPTAAYKTAYSATEAIEILEADEFGDESAPVVAKADGLAAGKGVVVAKDRDEAINAINELETLAGKHAAEKIVLEECLTGREVSLLMFADGEDFALMPSTRDHKRIGEGDKGPNTGGMGTITDASLLSEEQTQQIIEEIIKPTLKGCKDEGFPFRGVLFLGLMMTAAGPKLLEYNVRFGDPETQSILVRLNTDLLDICEAMLGCRSPRVNKGVIDGEENALANAQASAPRLGDLNIRWQPGNSACVVLASKGYPGKPQKGDVINGLDAVASMQNVTVFHSGTAFGKDEGGRRKDESTDSNSDSSLIPHRSYLTSGGRVLGVTATAENLQSALKTAYEAVEKISWDGMQYRRDIGK